MMVEMLIRISADGASEWYVVGGRGMMMVMMMMIGEIEMVLGVGTEQ